jgi:hypothetical protein
MRAGPRVDSGAGRSSFTQTRALAPQEGLVMTRKLLQLLILPVLAGSAAVAAGAHAPEVNAGEAFTLLRSLEGAWTAAPQTNSRSSVRFELSANGTVLVEHYTNPAIPGGGRMMSAYHVDGKELLLTHYCIANNQPTLRAERFDPASREVQFEFVRATNLATPESGHMRRAKYKVIDKDHFVTEWEFFENGARKMTEIEAFTRVK